MGLRSWLGGAARRRTGPPDGTAPAADTQGEPTPGPGAGAGGAWRDLPPLQRTADGLGLLTDPGGFRASLDTWQDVSLSRPLGHLVSPEAPAGLLYGVASPAGVPAAPGHEAVPAPPPGPAPRGTGPAPVAVQRTPDTAALTSAAGTATGTATGTAARTATETAAGTGTAPVRHLAGLPFTVEPPPAPAPEAPPAVRELPVAPTAPVQRTAEPPRPARPPHHHLGVGEPLARLPFTAQREPAGRSVPAPARPEAELPSSSGPFAEAAAPAVPEGPVAPAHPLLGEDPLVPAVEGPAPQAGVPGSDAGPTHGLPPETADAVRPLTVVGVQRLPSAVASAPPAAAEGPERTAGLTGERPLPLFTGTGRAEAPDPGPAVVVARWAVGADAPGPSRPSGPAPGAAATAGTVPVPVVVPTVQRVPVPPSGPGSHRPRAFGAAVPGVGAVPANGPWTDAGSAAVAAGVAQRAVDGSVVFGAPSPPLPAATPGSVQRTAGPAPEPEPVPDPPPAPAPDPAPPVSAPPSRVPAAPADGREERAAHHVDDELVRALFPRLSRLLKAELRLERERAGFLISTRH